MRLGLAVISMVLCPATAVCDSLQESWCVDALEQVAALQAMSPVYKPSDDGPQFIDDADRPAEIARLQKIIRTSCSTNPKERSRQESEAFRLHVARSPECGIEWDCLPWKSQTHVTLRPASHSSASW
jgi:hypothetical protein